MNKFDPRDLEWQRRYEQNDTPWDKGKPAPPLVRYLTEHEMAGRLLVPGCGKGHDVRALAAQAGAQVVGLDLSRDAVAQATQLAARSPVAGTANFVVGDFFKMPTEMHGSFDWLVEHTCFCAIDPGLRKEYVLSAAEALRPEGKVFGIFYLNPDVAAGPPFAITREELFAFFDPYFNLLEQWVPDASFPGRENRELVVIFQKR